METQRRSLRVPLARVECAGKELVYLEEVLQSGWLTTAAKTLAFEERFANEVGARHACAVNSCTAALHLALEAMGVRPGDQVLVPTMTFVATAEVVRYLGADPVFLDVDYRTRLLTPGIVRAALDRHPDAKALMVVHFGGQAAEMASGNGSGILEICHERGVRIVEDAAHAFPCRNGSRTVGSIGDVTCFSFYANKTITTGEGGMLTTDSEDIARRVRVMRLHGIDRDVWRRFTDASAGWDYDVVAPGYKYNMPDVAAAIGLAQLERAHAFRAERERCARFYLDRLASIAWLDLPTPVVPHADHAWHLFPVVVKPGAPLSRAALIARLNQAGIGTGVHYRPVHRMTYYRERYGLAPERFPNAERIWQGTLSLPIYPSLTMQELDYVCSTLQKALEG
jgi:dTDP-4-amino-4,6-dideoxygalactose transaminase